jgi:hypothetical protein
VQKADGFGVRSRPPREKQPAFGRLIYVSSPTCCWGGMLLSEQHEPDMGGGSGSYLAPARFGEGFWPQTRIYPTPDFP